VGIRRSTSTNKHRPTIQGSACRTTPAPAVQKTAQGGSKANFSDDPTDWSWIAAALSRYFGQLIQLYDTGEINRPAEGPGQSLGSLADSDRDALWYPPRGTLIYYADGEGRPCERKEACFWTFAGSPTWFWSDVYPPPPH